ncbi:MAG: hypothetical protein IJ728_12805 [Selenomonadaceae bacterium]|nr:hypothetical protein [Selenomonadaceae bacterium]
MAKKYIDYELFEAALRQNAEEIKRRFALKSDLESISGESDLTLDELFAEFPADVVNKFKEGENNG